MDYPKIEKFIKKNEYLICIDSDGTAMDSMNTKHKNCFGPCFVEEWNLQDHNDEVLNVWNEVNLYSATRGFNRFITFTEVLSRFNGKYLHVEDFQVLANWVKTASELSNKCLEETIAMTNSDILKKTYHWSLAVNQEIKKLSARDNRPFHGVQECLAYAFGKVDISVISSANMSAIIEEWNHFGLMQFVGAMTSQEIGTKAQCIEKMLLNGYDSSHVLMIGDAFPDVEAAKANGVFYYPIVADHEQESWKELKEFYLDEFKAGNYSKHQDNLLNKFYNYFNK